MKKWWLATPLVVALLLLTAVPSYAWRGHHWHGGPRVFVGFGVGPFWGYPYWYYPPPPYYAHHYRHLGDALGGHVGLVVEDAPEMVAVGKHLVLPRQVGAA